MPLTKFTGTLSRKQAAHLLRRATFGATRNQIEEFTGLTIDQALDRLFQALNAPEPPIDPETGEAWILPNTPGENNDRAQQNYVRGWWIALMLGLGANPNDKLAQSFRERVTFFLHTYFTTISNTVDNSRATYYQLALHRHFILDQALPADQNFKAYTKKICIDNAMLKVLDGTLNVKGNPNENFSREMFELYTIGKGLELKNQVLQQNDPISDESDYRYFTEQDIQEAAKILSGYSFDNNFANIDPDTGLPQGVITGVDEFGEGTARQHDNDPKQFSFRFQNQVISPQADLLIDGSDPSQASTLQELDDLIEMVFAQVETSRHICRRLYRFFVYHDITIELDDTVINDMVNVFQSNNYKFEPLLRTLLSSQHFFDSADNNPDNDNFGALIKSPLDLITGTINFFEVPLPDYTTDTENFYMTLELLVRQMNNQGMDFFNPFDIAGHEAYFQYPLFNRYWISTNSLTQRYDLLNRLVNQGMDMNMLEPGELGIDVVAYVQNNIPNAIASDARELVKELVSLLFPLADRDTLSFDPANDDDSDITAERMNYLLNFFLGTIDADPEGTWTVRWNNGFDPETVQTQLVNLFKALLQSPEYQLF